MIPIPMLFSVDSLLWINYQVNVIIRQSICTEENRLLFTILPNIIPFFFVVFNAVIIACVCPTLDLLIVDLSDDFLSLAFGSKFYHKLDHFWPN